MAEYMAYVGLDIHKDTIASAVAWPGRADPEYRGIILNRCRSVQKLIHGLQGPHGEALSFAYEAGPCGYGVYREITGTGHDCQVVAPGLIPRRPADRVKTDRRDALTLARLHRAGELTPVWVPGPGPGGGARSDPCTRGHEGARTQGPTASGGLPAASWPGLWRQEPVDAGTFSLAGAAEIRSSTPADGLSGVRGRSGRGREADRRARGPDARDTPCLVATPHGRGFDESTGRVDDHGDDHPSRARRSDALRFTPPVGGLPRSGPRGTLLGFSAAPPPRHSPLSSPGAGSCVAARAPGTLSSPTPRAADVHAPHNVVGARGSEVSLGRFLQDQLVQCQVRHCSLQAPVLALELLQAPCPWLTFIPPYSRLHP